MEVTKKREQQGSPEDTGRHLDPGSDKGQGKIKEAMCTWITLVYHRVN